MTIPSSSRGKKRKSEVHAPLEEKQVDTVPYPEPIGISTDSRFNYYLILCDRYTRIFGSIGIKDKPQRHALMALNRLYQIFHN